MESNPKNHKLSAISHQRKTIRLRFLKLTTDWPEVMLKVTLFNAGFGSICKLCTVDESWTLGF